VVKGIKIQTVLGLDRLLKATGKWRLLGDVKCDWGGESGSWKVTRGRPSGVLNSAFRFVGWENFCWKLIVVRI
jgi:hypothetical protein